MAASLEMNEAMTDGAIMMEEAKMTGMTPALLTLIGRKEARAMEAVCPPFPACWTGILRLAVSKKTTPATIRMKARIYRANWKAPVIKACEP